MACRAACVLYAHQPSGTPISNVGINANHTISRCRAVAAHSMSDWLASSFMIDRSLHPPDSSNPPIAIPNARSRLVRAIPANCKRCTACCAVSDIKATSAHHAPPKDVRAKGGSVGAIWLACMPASTSAPPNKAKAIAVCSHSTGLLGCTRDSSTISTNRASSTITHARAGP